MPTDPSVLETMQALARELSTPQSRRRIAPAVGVHVGVPEEVYHEQWDAASNSQFSILKSKSPAHLMAHLAEPPKSTEALRIGHAVHSAILEPDSFESNYIVAATCEQIKKGDGKRCTNSGIVQTPKGWACGIHSAGLPVIESAATVISESEYTICLKVRDAVHAHAKAHGLLSGDGAQKELSIVWVDRDTGLLCKARIDCRSPLIAGGVIVDVKSARDASPDGFAKSIYDHGYHRQGALYLEGCEAVELPTQHFVNVAVEKEAPFAVVVYRLREDAILAGANQLKPLKALYADCLAKGEWPGYSGDVMDISIPEWAAKRIEQESSDEAMALARDKANIRGRADQ